MYHFMSGYTAKVAGTEMGVTEPEATFSACFGAAFMVWHPSKYATLLAEKIEQYNTHVWLINTGWIGGGTREGKRISLPHTRAIINAVHDRSLAKATYERLPIFDLHIPKSCANVADEILNPSTFWKDEKAYWKQAQKLAVLFQENFKQFESGNQKNIAQYGPQFHN